MSWNDAKLLESKLKLALDTFDWSGAEAVCNEIIERIKTDVDLLPEATAKRLLQSLRRKRCFTLMVSLADAIMQSGLRTPQIRRQYAQALIDQGMLGAAEVVLQSIIQDPQGVQAEELEARGLTGRIYKQLYVNNDDPNSARNRANLSRSLNEYHSVYRLNPYEYLWHGINVVAMTERARRDNLPPAGLPDAAAMAQDILATLADRESKIVSKNEAEGGDDSLPAYDVATRIEAYVALGLHEKTEESARQYFVQAEGEALTYIACNDADAFEIYSTIRQFKEVWQLNDKTPPGNNLLPILDAGYLRKQGAVMEKKTGRVGNEAATVSKAMANLEATFTPDSLVTLRWYRMGLERCKSVARIESPDGRGHGTGWLVKAEDFFSDRKGVLLLTNAHVVCENPNPFDEPPLAIDPSEVRVNFQAAEGGTKEPLTVDEKIVWSSPRDEMDATFLTLQGEAPAEPLVLHDKVVEMGEPPPRLYIIGHPGGRDLEISLQDNYLLGCKDPLIHYRTPTEPGSSGSPVFEHKEWKVVALHHKGGQEMKKLNDPSSTYKANEGIMLSALRAATMKPN